MDKILNNGERIPVMGLGTYKDQNPNEVKNAVKWAIDAGYRHIDCAWINENEKEIGRAINSKLSEKIITRQEVFIATKLWNNFHERDKVVTMLRKSLRKLKLDYVDLFLIHWPMGFKSTAKKLPVHEGKEAYSDVDYLETWQGMEKCLELGYTKNIGLANFNSQQIHRILAHCKYKPTVNQVEVNLSFNQKKLIKFCHDRGIVVTAYFPFGNSELSLVPGFREIPILDEEILRIARKHEKTAAQIVLNYLISLGICVLPKPVTQIRIQEYIKVFDFKLDQDDIDYLDSCNRNQRTYSLNAFCDHKYYPFNTEF